MKKLSISIVMVLVVSLLSVTAAAQNKMPAKANIPFSFTVHNQTLQAGTYMVRPISANVIRIEEAGTQRGVTLLAHPSVEGQGAGKLVFHRYGSRAFLRAVVAPAGAYGVELPQSSAEAESARQGGAKTLLAVALQ
jgi:hypothetical protein